MPKCLIIDALLLLYYSLVLSHLIQSTIIWVGAPKSKINPVRVDLNKILRVIRVVKYNENQIHLTRTIECKSPYRQVKVTRTRIGTPGCTTINKEYGANIDFFYQRQNICSTYKISNILGPT